MLKKIVMLIACLIPAMMSLHAQLGTWHFVGPYSNNNANGQEFETAQMNNIIMDPDDSLHMFAGSKFGGLWETTNGGGNWSNINTSLATGLNGVLGLAFRNSTQILVGNYTPGDYSTGVFLYDFVTDSWQVLTALPAGTTPYVIKSVAVH